MLWVNRREALTLWIDLVESPPVRKPARKISRHALWRVLGLGLLLVLACGLLVAGPAHGLFHGDEHGSEDGLGCDACAMVVSSPSAALVIEDARELWFAPPSAGACSLRDQRLRGAVAPRGPPARG